VGLIYGQYDAKEEGFVPGGMTLHNMMLPHGPDRDASEKASRADLEPQKLEGTMAFLWEMRLPQHLTEWASGVKVDLFSPGRPVAAGRAATGVPEGWTQPE
jgi:homogentisate 1,2-dioxygenase